MAPRSLYSSLRRAGCKREGARALATHPWAKEGVAAVHAGCGGVGGSGAAASKQLALCVCRLCVGCARAGLVRDTRGEWLVACKARAGRVLRCFQGTRKGVRCTEARRAGKDRDAWAGGFDGRAADPSVLRVVLLLRASASAMPPLGPRLL